MDLTELELEYLEKKTYMFLSMTWAIIADIDINSEVIRYLGPMRLTIWGAYRTLFVKSFEGTLSFISDSQNN